MFLIFLIKNMCLLAFYFTYTNMLFYTPMSSMVIVYFIIFISLSVSYFLNLSKKYNYLKYLPMLGILISLQLTNNTMEVIKVIILYSYMFYIALKDKYSVDYCGFRDLFIRLFLITLPLFIIVYFSNGFGVFYRICLPYLIVFNISGLYLMRIIRHGNNNIKKRKFSFENIAFIVLISIVIIVLSIEQLYSYIANMLKYILMDIIVPIILKILNIIFWPVLKLLNLSALGLINSNKNISFIEKSPEVVEFSVDGYSFIIAFVLIAILTIVITVIIKRDRFKRKQNEFIKLNKMSQLDGISSYVTFFEDDIGKTNKPKKTVGKSLNQIRYWYRKFLILCHERKMDIYSCDNSQTIYDKSYEIFKNQETDLCIMKETYRKARYSEESIDKEDIKIIKSSYKNLEKSN